jgi:hypothetical protein
MQHSKKKGLTAYCLTLAVLFMSQKKAVLFVLKECYIVHTGTKTFQRRELLPECALRTFLLLQETVCDDDDTLVHTS